MQTAKTLILGATSTVAKEVAHQFAKNHKNLILAGRNLAELERMKKDFCLRYGISVDTLFCDADRLETHDQLLLDLEKKKGPVEGIFVAIGYLGNPETAQKDWEEVAKIFCRNFTGVISLIHRLIHSSFRNQLKWIAAISSVAGDRGKKSNYLYGAAKGGLSTYLQGLDHALARENIRVMDIKLGMVDSPMTFHSPHSFLCVSPSLAAQKIYQALCHPKPVAYIPGFWKYLMMIIKQIPRNIFVKSNL